TYLRDPNEVSEEWRNYFDQLPRVDENTSTDTPHKPIREQFLLLSKNQRRSRPVAQSAVSTDHERKQVKVLQLINAYRGRGDQQVRLGPPYLMERQKVPELARALHGLSRADLDVVSQTGSLFIGQEEAPPKDIISAHETTYCGAVGAEYMHIVYT